MTSAYVRPNTLCGGRGEGGEGREGNQVSARLGKDYVIFSCGKSRKKWRAIVVALKNLFTLGTGLQLFHSIMIL